MSLASGTRLGHYEIVGPLGAGGMGEVYRARDTRLDRAVAIKILPSNLAQDAAARARFEREAKAVAALSDPHILAIHDFDVQGTTAYAVTELLEGETLRDRIQRGPLPSKKATQIARDIAQGLSAAHDKGLVHRDIKPANVFITTAGHVKILDFGLARQVSPAAGGAATATEFQATDPGTVLGTVGYMSPEQVRGDAADHRSDIFSLGCVLFETISGRRAFDRATAAETMTAILREDAPELVRSDKTAVPAALDQVIRHCLEKRPEERFQSARDLAFALQSLSSGSGTSGPVAPIRTATGSGRVLRQMLAAAAFLVAGAAGGHYLWTRPAPGSPAQPLGFEQISDAPGVQTEPSLSPDGKTVVYVQQSNGTSHLFLLRIGSRTPVSLSRPTDDDSHPAFSPDGERIAFRSERDGGGIFVMTATGESIRRLTDFGYYPSWSPDGKEIVLSGGKFESPTDVGTNIRGLAIVNTTTGEKRELAKDVRAFQPAWSPHGRRLAFWNIRGDTGQRDIWTVAADAAGGAATPVAVTDDAVLDWSPAWSPDGAFLYFSSRRGGTLNLWRVGIDESSGRVRGAPEPVTTPSNWSGYVSFSRDGSRMAFASLNWRSTLLRASVDLQAGTLTGSPSPILRDSRIIRDHDLSPDGQWIAFMETGEQENLILVRTDGSEYRRLTDDAFRNRGPVWSPDGQRLAFYSDRSGSYEAWTIRPDGSGLARVTTTGSGGLNFPVWSPDGKRLAISKIGVRWWQIVNAEGNAAPLPTESLPHPADNVSFLALSWSPDGRKMVGGIMGVDGSVRGYAVYHFGSRSFSTSVSRAGAWSAAWFPDGRHFLFRDRAGVWLMTEDGAAPKLLVPVGGYFIGRSIAAARDGRSFTYTETGVEGQIWLARIKK